MDILRPPQPLRLIDQVRQVARLKYFSPRTEKSYLYYVHDFILFHNKQHPKDLGVAVIRAYLTHLAINCLIVRLNWLDFNETFSENSNLKMTALLR
jgi:Phage integrase, N-terminal SAM-like domain